LAGGRGISVSVWVALHPPLPCERISFSVSFIRTLVIGFQAHLDNTGSSHSKIFNSVKIFFPKKVTSQVLEFEIWTFFLIAMDQIQRLVYTGQTIYYSATSTVPT
jgi:hypothetical protein